MKTYPELVAEGIKRTVFKENQETLSEDFRTLAKKAAVGLNKVFPDNPKTAKHFDANQSDKQPKDPDDIWDDVYKAARMSDEEIEEFADEIEGEDLSGSALIDALAKSGWKFGKKLSKLDTDKVNPDALEIMYSGWMQ